MARRGLGPADWLVLAVTPALLTSLVSCLLFFVVDILYRGQHGGRMEWILFFGTMGMVLIGRIRLIDEVAKKAGLYSAALGGLVWAGLAMYIPPPEGWHRAAHIAVMGFLVALGFWITRILVTDTTDLDDDDEVEGQGLLTASGLEDDPAARLRAEVDQATGRTDRKVRHKRNRVRRPPGGTVVMFCLLTLPLFGLGQALIPTDEPARRWWSLLLLMGYLASGFLLLMNCCFLGLRRYAARRGISMPAEMAAAWLGTGAMVVALVVLGAALVPRPADSGAIGMVARLVGAGEERKQADKKESGGFFQDDAKAKASSGDPKAREEKGQGAQGKQGNEKEGKNSPAQKVKDRQDQRQADSGAKQSAEPPPAEKGDLIGRIREIVSGMWPALKVAVAIGVVMILGFFLLWRLARGNNDFELLERWLGYLFDWWERLWMVPPRPRRQSAANAEPRADTWKSFDDFGDPFTGRYPLDGAELVREVYAGLVAWSRDRRTPPMAGETAREFTRRVGGGHPALERGLALLADLMDRVEYAPGMPVEVPRDPLRELWVLLRAS